MPPFENHVTGANEIAITGTSDLHHGITGRSRDGGAGVLGVSATGEGISGFSRSGHGVVGQSDEASGVRGLSKAARAVEGLSESGNGVVGASQSGIGVTGSSETNHGIAGHSDTMAGVRGVSRSGRGVEGWSESAYGVSGDSTSSAGVRGTSVAGRGVEGWSTRSEGVFGTCERGTGVRGVAGRSRFFGSFGVAVDSSLFRVGTAARQLAMAAAGVEGHVTSRPPDTATDSGDTRETPPASDALAEPSTADTVDTVASSPAAPVAAPSPAAIIGEPFSPSVEVELLPGPHVLDNSAGIGVSGEHLGGGIGVRAASQDGMGLAAYSTGHEAVHAETRSPVTAAIAAYNLNPRGTGAAIFARKDGSRGHAGFFDGKVWVSSELAVGGDILLANADCAEDFDVADRASASPGTVMVVGHEGALHASTQPYDKRVVGIVSGAGHFKPALILDRQASDDDRAPIALLGKVCCRVTAENGAIEVGDLLTTSPTAGHAMKASDPTRAFGAVIGKALGALSEGRGLIPVLIALQ